MGSIRSSFRIATDSSCQLAHTTLLFLPLSRLQSQVTGINLSAFYRDARSAGDCCFCLPSSGEMRRSHPSGAPQPLHGVPCSGILPWVRTFGGCRLGPPLPRAATGNPLTLPCCSLCCHFAVGKIRSDKSVARFILLYSKTVINFQIMSPPV